MEVRALRPEELESWFDFVSGTFGQSREYFVRHWEGDPDRSIDSIRVAVDGGRILSTLRIFRRQVYLGGHQVAVGGIGEVCTDPACRGQGLSGQLLAESIQLMARWSIPVSVLFASLHGHYGRFGWRLVPVDLGVSVVAAGAGPYEFSVPNPRDPAEARPLKQLYKAFAPQFQGTTVRDSLAYWTHWIPGEWKRALTARRRGRLTGYLAANWTGPGTLYVEDFAALPAEVGEVFSALVGALADERGLRSVRVTYPLALQPGLELVGREANDGPMYRVIQPSLLPLKAAEALDRLLRGERAGHLIFQSDCF